MLKIALFSFLVGTVLTDTAHINKRSSGSQLRVGRDPESSTFEDHWSRVINSGHLGVLITGGLFFQILRSHNGGFNFTLSIITITSDMNVPEYIINMIVIIQSQKLSARPVLEEAIKQFQEEVSMKVSRQEPRKLAAQQCGRKGEVVIL